MTTRPAALLTVYDDEGVTVASVPLAVRVIQGCMATEPYDGGVGFALEVRGELEVQPEWVGKMLDIQVAPSAVASATAMSECDSVAREFGLVIL